MDKVPALTSFKEIVGSIDRNKLDKGIINLNKFIKKGTKVGLRIDIPAFNRFGKNVVTVHEGTGKRFTIGYGSTGSISNVTFRTNVSTAAKIGSGKWKEAFAMAEGEWLDESTESIQARAEEALNSPEWIQVSMNPTRSSFFFDKADGNPVISADEVLQVGNLVLAKNAQKIDLNTKEGMAQFEKQFSAKTKEGVTYQYRKGRPSFGERVGKIFETEGERAAEDLARFHKEAGIEVKIIDDVEAQILGQERNMEGSVQGLFLADKDSGVIYLNRDALKRAGKTLVYHEGIHPVINILRNTNPELYKKVIDGLKAEAKRNPAIARAIRQIEAVKEYQKRGPETIEDETIVEVLARIAAGDIDINKVDKSLKDSLIDLWNRIAKILRIPQVNTNPSSQEFRDFADKLSTALTQGGTISDVVGAENIKKFQNVISDGQGSIDARISDKGVQVPRSEKLPLKIVASKEEEVMRKINELLDKYPNALTDKEQWKQLMSRVFAINVDGEIFIPAFPEGLSRMASSVQETLKEINKVSDEQRRLASEGLKGTKEIGELYKQGKMDEVDTGLYFLWNIMSIGISPYPQESGFLQAVNGGIDKYIKLAAAGEFNKNTLEEYLDWVNQVLPLGSPGAGSKSNLNSFGKSFLSKAAEKIEKGEFSGKTKLQALHEILSDRKTPTNELRRKWQANMSAMQFNNKIFDFILLTTGRSDLFVTDRVRVDHFWDGNSFKKKRGLKESTSLYDGSDLTYGAGTGAGFSKILSDVPGLVFNELANRTMTPIVEKAYKQIGVKDYPEVGRFHWETWVAASSQEVSHGSIDAIVQRKEKGEIQDAGIRQGKYGAWDFNFSYRKRAGKDFVYEFVDNEGNTYVFDKINEIQKEIENQKKKNYETKNRFLLPDAKGNISRPTKGLSTAWYDATDESGNKLVDSEKYFEFLRSKAKEVIPAPNVVEDQGVVIEKGQESVSSFSSKLENDYGVTLDLFEGKNGDITIGKISVPKEKRGQGIGSQVMQDIIDYADANGKRLLLTPSTSFGATSVSRLNDFYKGFGFVDNKSKNKDFSTKESMYRNPSKPSTQTAVGGKMGQASIGIDRSSLKSVASAIKDYDRNQEGYYVGKESSLFPEIEKLDKEIEGKEFYGYHSSKTSFNDQYSKGPIDPQYEEAILKAYQTYIAEYDDNVVNEDYEAMASELEDNGFGFTFVSTKGPLMIGDKYKYGDNLYKIYGDEDVFKVDDTNELNADIIIAKKPLYFKRVKDAYDIADDYIKAKEKGSNPKLVKVVDRFLDKISKEEEPTKLTGDDVRTGKPVTINVLKNPQKAPNLGAEFGQDVEPAGNYVTQQETDFVPQGWNTGTVSFKKPLVINVDSDSLVKWKRDLSKKYGGLTGKKLTDRLKLFDYDGIITRLEDGSLGEIIAFDNSEQYIPSKGQASVDIERTSDETRQLMEDAGDAIEQEIASGTDPQKAVDDIVGGQDWYKGLNKDQKEQFDEILQEYFGASPKVSAKKATGIGQSIKDIVDNYYKLKDKTPGARDAINEILDADPKLKYIYDNIRKINKQLQEAGVITDKTDGCP